jgi:hypothetical protein
MVSSRSRSADSRPVCRKAEGATARPTAASAVVVSSRVSWIRAHITWVDRDVPLLVRADVLPELWPTCAARVARLRLEVWLGLFCYWT